MRLDERDLDDLRHGRDYPGLIHSIDQYFKNKKNYGEIEQKSNKSKNPNKGSVMGNNRLFTEEELHDLERFLYTSCHEGQLTLSELMGFLELALRHSGKENAMEKIRHYKDDWYRFLVDSLTMPYMYLSLLLKQPIRWSRFRLDTLLEIAFHRVEPYLKNIPQVTIPQPCPEIKGG